MIGTAAPDGGRRAVDLRAIEDRKQAILVRRGDDPAPRARGRQRRCAVDIPVMAVVLDELVVGEDPSACRIERDHRVGVEVLSGAIERVEVRCRIAGRNVEDALAPDRA